MNVAALEEDMGTVQSVDGVLNHAHVGQLCFEPGDLPLQPSDTPVLSFAIVPGTGGKRCNSNGRRYRNQQQ
jgi:hypothetical protein